jgi:hypothetical protein
MAKEMVHDMFEQLYKQDLEETPEEGGLTPVMSNTASKVRLPYSSKNGANML